MLTSRRGYGGFSLVELMIAITIGLIVVAGVINIFVNTIKSNSDNLRTTRLNQEMRMVIDVMTRDIRRASYWGKATNAIGTAATNPFALGSPDKFGTEAANSCLVYSYDADGDGNVDLGSGGSGVTANTDERYGFRLSSGAVQMRQGGAACSASTSASSWQNITDENAITIAGLQFGVTSTAVDIDGDAATTPSMLVRKVTINISAQLKSDTSVTRTLTETVRVRNDIYSP